MSITDQQFVWNTEHQLTESVSTRNGTEQRTTYGYDAFGRRSWKRDAFRITRFIREGNRLLSEERGSRQHIWIYEDESYAPLAQISLQQGEMEHDAQIHWFHNDVSGLPRELTGADGSVVWRAVYRAWGNTLRTEQAAVEGAEPIYQPLRYQGQYFDAETGLHYNCFRYYDPDAGRFVSQDPIGLAGGVNLYQYAPNPLTWIDTLGLSKCKDSFEQARNKALKWLEERGFRAERVNTGKFGATKGKPIGMTTADGKTGFRIEYDDRSGAHINVFSGKDKGEHYLFEATESSVKRLQKLFNLPSKPWRTK